MNYLLPGKNPNIYYVCLGYFPEKLVQFPTKANLPIVYHFLISFFLYLFASIRIKIHRKKQRANDLVQTASVPIHQGVINFQTLEIVEPDRNVHRISTRTFQRGHVSEK